MKLQQLQQNNYTKNPLKYQVKNFTIHYTKDYKNTIKEKL